VEPFAKRLHVETHSLSFTPHENTEKSAKEICVITRLYWTAILNYFSCIFRHLYLIFHFWNQLQCAYFLPIPGNLSLSSINRWQLRQPFRRCWLAMD